jgi:hypothetical protein
MALFFHWDYWLFYIAIAAGSVWALVVTVMLKQIRERAGCGEENQ